MKNLMLALLLALTFPFYCTPITINDPSDYLILDQFFRRMIKEEAFGHVLEGVKPLSALNHYSYSGLLFPHSRFFQWTVLIKEAIKRWNLLAPEQKDYVFKTTKVFNHTSENFHHELLFINREKMQQTLDANLDLFRILLGPTIESSLLGMFIADSPQSLNSIIKSNNTLMGILLGYGTYNSLMGGRLEEIEGAHNHLDHPPFTSDNLSQKAREKIDWNLQNAFLTRTEHAHTIVENLFVRPGLGCISLQEEEKKINAQQEAIPATLLKENPRFIFGAYKNASNHDLFEKAQASQKHIQALLTKPDLLEYVLEKITGEKPIINCSSTLLHNKHLAIEGNAEEAVAETVWLMMQELDRETVPIFLDAFCRCDPSDNKKPKFRMAPGGVLTGLKLARSNLQIADAQLSTWSKTKDLKEIVPQGLYFETIKPGQGNSMGASTDLLMSYVIEDGVGTVLSAQHRCWIDLSQTIPAFAHGIKEMREGGTRKIYIHPRYGYGALTTLSPCVTLIAQVTLHRVNEQTTGKIPLLSSIDLDWVNDPKFFENIKEASYQNATYLGHLWGVWLSKSTDLHFPKLCNQLRQLSENTLCQEPSNDKQNLCNRVFWNLISVAD